MPKLLGNNQSEVNIDENYMNENQSENVQIPSSEELEAVKLEWESHSKEIMNNLEDPAQFYPAIRAYLKSNMHPIPIPMLC